MVSAVANRALELVIGGKTYTLVLDTNAMVRLEDHFSAFQQDVVEAQRDELRSVLATIAVSLDPKVGVDPKRATQLAQMAKRALSKPVTDVSFDRVLAKVNNGHVKHIRAVVWAALQRHHPAVTIEQAGDLIQEAGGLSAFGDQLMALATQGMPDPADAAELSEGTTANPQTAQARTRTKRDGVNSSSPHAAPA